MPKKLPFTKDDYKKMLDAKLGGQQGSGNPLLDRLKAGVNKIVGK